MATDFTKLPLQILVDLINADNATSLTPADITFSAATPTSSGLRNTAVTITAVAGRGYKNSKDLTYDRVDLAAIPGSRSKEFVKGSAATVHDLIPAINAAYQLNLQPEDVYDDPMPVFSGSVPHETQTLNLRAKPGSYIYRGTLALTIDGNDVDLSTLITVTELNGLTYPAM